MGPDRQQAIERICQTALELDQVERAQFLAEACRGDVTLRRDVEALLAQSGDVSSFLESPALEAVAADLARAPSLLGQRIGPYAIGEALGAGGMGEVYGARDTRLNRDVAIKVLPAALAQDPERLRRFKQEACSAGMLNHPNVLIVHDVGVHEGLPYIVSELLEGVTLRARLAQGPLPARKAADYALQIARGLAAVHERGIVHRDLKPENLLMTRDGRLKILDFGLAKLRPPSAGLDEVVTPARERTEPGAVMGTPGYMAPEQVRGEQTDHRADIFAFGAVLYELLTGRRAFPGASRIEILNAILKEEPRGAREAEPDVGPGLERVWRRCLEKEPQDRFQCASDLAFAVEAFGAPPRSERDQAETRATGSGSLAHVHAWRLRGVAALLLFAVGAAAFWAGRRARPAAGGPPSFQRLTFQRGTVWTARFAPDGRTVVYGADWEGRGLELYSIRTDSLASQPLGLPAGDVLAVSGSGEMAISIGRRPVVGWESAGTLARVPLGGGAPREVMQDVQEADWAPGDRLALVRDSGGRRRLELPPGRVLYETSGYLSHARVSPGGELVAFAEHAVRGDNAGAVAVVDMAGNRRVLSPDWGALAGLAWPPSGREVWFTATRTGGNSQLYAAGLGGSLRLLLQTVGPVGLYDISREGRVLLSRQTWRRETRAFPARAGREHSLSWLDWSLPRDLSPDGERLLFDEQGEGAGAPSVIYLRRTDGSPPVRLGEGGGLSLSPDGRWVLARVRGGMELLPTVAGEPRPLPAGGITAEWAGWLGDGRRVVVAGHEPGRPTRLYEQRIDGGAPRPFTPEGVGVLTGSPISPDGAWVAAAASDRRVQLFAVAGGDPRPVLGLTPDDQVIGWTPDGRSFYVFRGWDVPARVAVVEIASGRRSRWKELEPPDPAGVSAIGPVLIAADGRSYVYSYRRLLDELYLVDGLR